MKCGKHLHWGMHTSKVFFPPQRYNASFRTHRRGESICVIITWYHCGQIVQVNWGVKGEKVHLRSRGWKWYHLPILALSKPSTYSTSSGSSGGMLRTEPNGIAFLKRLVTIQKTTVSLDRPRYDYNKIGYRDRSKTCTTKWALQKNCVQEF